MTQDYSDPTRENDPYSLPDIEVFYFDKDELDKDETNCIGESGWYWWTCLPGCLPDSDPIGPFATEQEALEDAQDIE